MGADQSVAVPSTNAPGTTGLSGLVVDSELDTIPGARVTLSFRLCAHCVAQPTTTRTDTKGAFAFIDVPDTNQGYEEGPAPTHLSMYTLVVSARGFGTYTEAGFCMDDREGYTATIELTRKPQTYTTDCVGAVAAGSGMSFRPRRAFRSPSPP